MICYNILHLQSVWSLPWKEWRDIILKGGNNRRNVVEGSYKRIVGSSREENKREKIDWVDRCEWQEWNDDHYYDDQIEGRFLFWFEKKGIKTSEEEKRNESDFLTMNGSRKNERVQLYVLDWWWKSFECNNKQRQQHEET